MECQSELHCMIQTSVPFKMAGTRFFTDFDEE